MGLLAQSKPNWEKKEGRDGKQGPQRPEGSGPVVGVRPATLLGQTESPNLLRVQA